jgi:CRISPR-associated protein (TIGR03986 family)
MQGEQRRDGFVNPYNFVPLWGKVPRRKPESHEYFVGNRGRIVCQIFFKTPFFIPHPERRFQLPETPKALAMLDEQLPCWVREKALEAWKALKERIKQAQNVEGYKGCEGHEMLALLRDEQEKPFIPGSSLKGAFRTIAEALSNSCLSQLEFEPFSEEAMDLLERWRQGGDITPNSPDDQKLARAIRAAKRFYSYRLIRSPSGVGKVSREGGWTLVEMKRARVFFRDREPYFDLTNYHDKQEVTATIRQGRPLDIVEEISSGETEGVLKITDVPGVVSVRARKKSQRFIYGGGQRIELPEWLVAAYDKANEPGIKGDEGKDEFIECDPRRAGKRSKRHPLKDEDIVYFRRNNKGQITHIGPTEIFRQLYRYSLDEILLRKHDDFLPCQKPENLCPACRLFGWVAPEAEEEATALKGFIHFSPARWAGESEPETQWVTLQPLGQPKPSCWQFYLNCQNVDQNAGYNDDNATIRGRKFYWHKPNAHANRPQSGANVNSVWDQRGGNGQPLADDQNKTVELLLPDNAVFEFTVDFENLSDAELGLLLLTLQPNLLGEQALEEVGVSSQLYHHFGMGKPLGLGSAEVQIKSITLFKDCQRYQSLEESGEERVEREEVAAFVKKFVTAFVRNAVKAQSDQIPVPSDDAEDAEWLKTFVRMPPIADLLTMLDWKIAKGLPVQYPPGGDERTNQSHPNMKEYWEAFRWFAHRHQREFLQKPRHMLKRPQEIKEKEGERQDGFPPRDLSLSGSSHSSHPPSRQQHQRERHGGR